MKMKNPSSLITTAAKSLLRRLCTAATAEKAAAVTAVNGHVEEESLYRKLSILRATGGTVTQTMNEYTKEGKIVTKDELERCARSLRKYKDYANALELINWMEEKNMNFSNNDYAIQLDLISKSKGETEAENYFNDLSPALQNQSTYGALLNCYCKNKLSDKALALFQKMEELNFASTPLAFDNLISLYMGLGKFEEVPRLVDEMKKRNIERSMHTYNALMQSHARLNNIEGSENVLKILENEDKGKLNWTSYSNLADIYVRAGYFDKAELALKKMETIMKYSNRVAYHFLISLYARISKLSEVKRVWTALKLSIPPTSNSSYLVMLQALDRLDDIEGVKECHEEWKENRSCHDMRISNAAIRVYLKHNMIKEAELVFAESPEKGLRSLFTARDMFMTYFLKNCQIDLAMKHMEALVDEVTDDKWRMSPELISAFMKCFEQVKDVDGAEDFCKLLKKVNSLDIKAYDALLRVYQAAGKMAHLTLEELTRPVLPK